MKKHTFAALAAVAAVAPALAQPNDFILNGYETGVSDDFVLTEMPIAGDFYQTTFGASNASDINPQFLALAPEAEFDTYLALGDGPVTPLENPNSPSIILNNSAQFGIPGEFNGSIFFANVSLRPTAGDDLRIFLGRFTTLDFGSSITGQLLVRGLALTSQNEAGAFITLTIGGPAVFEPFTQQSYLLEIDSFETTIPGTGPDAGTEVTVNDLYIRAIPAPASAALLALPAIAATRRRR